MNTTEFAARRDALLQRPPVWNKHVISGPDEEIYFNLDEIIDTDNPALDDVDWDTATYPAMLYDRNMITDLDFCMAVLGSVDEDHPIFQMLYEITGVDIGDWTYRLDYVSADALEAARELIIDFSNE